MENKVKELEEELQKKKEKIKELIRELKEREAEVLGIALSIGIKAVKLKKKNDKLVTNNMILKVVTVIAILLNITILLTK